MTLVFLFVLGIGMGILLGQVLSGHIFPLIIGGVAYGIGRWIYKSVKGGER